LERAPLFIALCCALICETIMPVGAPVLAGEQSARAPGLRQVSFLQGRWQGRGATGALVEEYWSGIEGDSMIGHCRMIKDGRTTFYELLAILDTPGGLILKMRHFTEGMKPWPEKDESGDCNLVSISGKEVVFGNASADHAVKVTYRRKGAASLYAEVEDTQNGKTSSYPFEYKLTK
jgi:Domain of unknown function (DUF6265)